MNEWETVPGWDDLVAAGRVAPPAATVVENAVMALRAAPTNVPVPAVVLVGAQTGKQALPPAGAPPPKRTWRRRGVLAVAGAAVVGVLASVVIVTTPAPDAVAAAALDKLVLAAAAAPGDEARPGQFRYIREENQGLMQRSEPDISQTEYWIGYDGGYWIRDEDGLEYHAPSGNSSWYEWGPGLAANLAELPRDPRALLHQLRAGVDQGEEVDRQVFYIIGNIFRTQMAPPDLRAALIRALAMLPQIRVEDRVADSRGRIGIGLFAEFDSPTFGTTAVLVFDSSTGLLWEVRDVYTNVPEVEHTIYLLESRTTLLDTGVVDRAPVK